MESSTYGGSYERSKSFEYGRFGLLIGGLCFGHFGLVRHDHGKFNPPGAVCNLSQNNRNIGQVVTPGGVTVEKTKHDIQVTCTKEGYQTATGYLDSETEGSTWGNILLGGGIGWAVDSASGSDNDYPDYITVTLVPNAAPVR